MANDKVTIHVVTDVEDGEVKALESLVDNIDNQAVNVNVDVDDGGLIDAEAKEDSLNGSASFSIDVDDAGVQGAMQNINDGINQAKQGLGELASGFGEVLSAAGSADQNQAFLQIGFDKAGSKNAIQDAKDAQSKIQDIVAQAPGDDIAMNSILSSAVAKDVKLMDKDMQGFANSVSDYFAGAEVNGKHAAEAIQDVRSYITSGNVAELQTTGIFDEKQLDELKDIDSVTDRVAKFQEMVGKSSYAGLGTADTMNNKMAEFDGMLAKSATTLGSFFTEGTKGAADFILKLNDMSGGLLGVGMVAVQEFGPGLFSMLQGIFIMIPGVQALVAAFGGLSGIAAAVGGALATIAWPVAIVAALAIAVYEVGKAFGWWKDIPTMFQAIQAGLGELWNAFTSNTYVQQAIQLISQGLTDAWNAVVGFGQAIMTALFGAGGQFDILSWAIQGLQTVLAAVGPVVVWYLQTMISNFRSVYSVCQTVWPYVASAIQSAMSTASNIIATARGVFQGLIGIWNACSGAVQSMASAIQGALDAAGSAWQGFQSTVMSVVQPIIDKINELKSAASNIPGIGGLFSGGIETPTVSTGGGYGSGPTTVSQGNTIIFNMYGDIRDEKTLDETIDAINNRIQFDALATGVGTQDNGSGAI